LAGSDDDRPEQPTLWAPIVSHTCAATMPNRGRLDVQLFGHHLVDLRRRFETTNAIDAARLFKPSVYTGMLQRTRLWLGRRIGACHQADGIL
jgi:hypothetical protein